MELGFAIFVYKRLYDIKYREENREKIKKQNQEYNKTPAGRAMQKRNRDKQVANHRKFIATPKYKKWKKGYDRVRVAKMNHGDFWESSLLLKEISEFVDNRRAQLDKGTVSKAQKRRRNINY